MSELEHYLDSARGGQAESSGAFSVDPVKARQKLALYQFSDPYVYVLRLVQAAVAAGAEQVTVSSGRRAVELTFNSRFAPESLEQLLTLAGAGPPHLAAGLYGALNARASRITLTSGTTRLSLTPGGGQVGQAEPVGGTRIVIRRKAPGFFWKSDRESALVRERCCYAALPVVCNGKIVNRAYLGLPGNDPDLREGERWFLGEPLTDYTQRELFLIAEEFRPDLVTAPWHPTWGGSMEAVDGLDWRTTKELRRNHSQSARRSRSKAADKCFARCPRLGTRRSRALVVGAEPEEPRAHLRPCHLALATRRDSQGDSQLVVVRDAVALTTVFNAFPSPGALAVVSGRALKTDAGGMAVIEDRNYTSLCQYLELLANS
ncbi:MAG: hypothetical protein KC910_02130 [Candidatus Eremiobacteraeota bacterium]|nr:hypothetical protein [Candidatus Eremiobacteraeota bacterium]